MISSFLHYVGFEIYALVIHFIKIIAEWEKKKSKMQKNCLNNCETVLDKPRWETRQNYTTDRLAVRAET